MPGPVPDGHWRRTRRGQQLRAGARHVSDGHWRRTHQGQQLRAGARAMCPMGTGGEPAGRPAAACRCAPRVRWALAEDPPRLAATCRCPPHDRWALVEDWWRPGRRWWRCACTCQALPGVTTLPPGWATLGHAVAGARARGGPAAARSLTAKSRKSTGVLYSSRREARGNLPGPLSFASLSEWP
jgi:hypothetical protein